MDRQSEKQRGWSWWYVLFLVQFVAVLWPPFYNKADPSFDRHAVLLLVSAAMVIVGAVLTAIVYFATDDNSSRGAQRCGVDRTKLNRGECRA